MRQYALLKLPFAVAVDTPDSRSKLVCVGEDMTDARESLGRLPFFSDEAWTIL